MALDRAYRNRQSQAWVSVTVVSHPGGGKHCCLNINTIDLITSLSDTGDLIGYFFVMCACALWVFVGVVGVPVCTRAHVHVCVGSM